MTTTALRHRYDQDPNDFTRRRVMLRLCSACDTFASIGESRHRTSELRHLCSLHRAAFPRIRWEDEDSAFAGNGACWLCLRVFGLGEPLYLWENCSYWLHPFGAATSHVQLCGWAGLNPRQRGDVYIAALDELIDSMWSETSPLDRVDDRSMPVVLDWLASNGHTGASVYLRQRCKVETAARISVSLWADGGKRAEDRGIEAAGF